MATSIPSSRLVDNHVVMAARTGTGKDTLEDDLAEFDAILAESPPTIPKSVPHASPIDDASKAPPETLEDLIRTRSATSLPHGGRRASPGLFSGGPSVKASQTFASVLPLKQPLAQASSAAKPVLYYSTHPGSIQPQVTPHFKAHNFAIPYPMQKPAMPAFFQTSYNTGQYPVPSLYQLFPGQAHNHAISTLPQEVYLRSLAQQQAQAINAARFIVSGIAPAVTEAMIQALFASYGTVKSVLLTRRDGVTTGTGKVAMVCFQDPSVCRRGLHGQWLGGTKLSVMEFMMDIQNRTEAREILQARYAATLPAPVQPASVTYPASAITETEHTAQQSNGTSQLVSEEALINLDAIADTSLLDMDLEDECSFPTLNYTSAPAPPLIFVSAGDSGYCSPSSTSASASSAHTQEVETPHHQLDMHLKHDEPDSEASQKLRANLDTLAITPLQGDKQAILELLMNLPEKQRRMCLFNPAYLKVKAAAALRLLEVEPAEEEEKSALVEI